MAGADLVSAPGRRSHYGQFQVPLALRLFGSLNGYRLRELFRSLDRCRRRCFRALAWIGRYRWDRRRALGLGTYYAGHPFTSSEKLPLRRAEIDPWEANTRGRLFTSLALRPL